MIITLKIVLLITSLVTGLMAGLFYAYSCSVNIGLGRLDDAGYLKAMQNINRAILNPWFFTSFFGALVLLPVCTYLHYRYSISQNNIQILFAASLIYIVGVFGITILGNVPLNEALDKFNIVSTSIEEIKTQRKKFEAPWNKLNLLRTIFAIIAFLLVSLFSIQTMTK